MAIENPRPEKVAVVDEVRARLSSAGAALLTEYRGLRVDELATLRQAVRDAGGDYKIFKNTLVRLAVADLGLESLDDLLTGPTALAFVDGDAVAVAKALRDFARTSPNLVIKGGVLGTKVLSAQDASALADMASREELLARLAGGLSAPLVQLAGLLAAVPRSFAYGLAALIDDRGGVPEPTDAAPAPTAEATEAPATEALAAPMDEALAAPVDEAPAAPVDEAPAAPVDEAPAAPVDEALAAPMDEALAAPMDEAPAAPMDEAPAPTAEGPAAAVDEAPAPTAEAPAAAVDEAPTEAADPAADQTPAPSAGPPAAESAQKE